jgi:hypothetical protein
MTTDFGKSHFRVQDQLPRYPAGNVQRLCIDIAE